MGPFFVGATLLDFVKEFWFSKATSHGNIVPFPAMKTIGLIGGTTWVSTMEYYRLLNTYVNLRLGGRNSAKVLLYSVEFDEVSRLQHEGKWNAIAALYVEIATKLQSAGAECLLLGANTMHKIADDVQSALRIPLVHIGEATAATVRQAGMSSVALLGTRYTMEMDFYRSRFTAQDIATIIPTEEEREIIHSAIYGELAKGIFSETTKQTFKTIIGNLVKRGAQGIVLGCTEIPLLIKQADSSVPVFDTTDIHVRAAIDLALS